MHKTPEFRAISRALVFANWKVVESAEAVQDNFAPAAESPFALMIVIDRRTHSEIEVGGVRSGTHDGEVLTLERELALYEQWRGDAHAMLSQIARRRLAEARRTFGARFARELERGVILGQARFEDGALTQNSVFNGPVNAHVAFAMALLLDAERPFGRMLRRCQLRTCSRFFMQESTGRPPKYCPECRAPGSEQNRKNARARTAKYRQKLMESSR